MIAPDKNNSYVVMKGGNGGPCQYMVSGIQAQLLHWRDTLPTQQKYRFHGEEHLLKVRYEKTHMREWKLCGF